MANPNGYVSGRRWSVGDATRKPDMDLGFGEYVDHLHYALNVILNSVMADGLNFSIAKPLHVVVATSPRQVWSFGMWRSSLNNGWYLLFKTSKVASFTRAQADGHVPLQGLQGVPPS